MSATILTGLPADRCPRCGLMPDPDVQGHRALDSDGQPTGCTPSGVLGLKLGQARRDAGMARTTDAHPDDAAIVDAAIREAVRRGRPFSANDLRHLTSQVEQPKVIGARVRSWVASKRLTRVGDVPSNDPATHAHKIGLYVGADRAA